MAACPSCTKHLKNTAERVLVQVQAGILQLVDEGSSLTEVVYKKDLLKNFAKSFRKTPALEFLYNNVAGLKI